jgi:hypothetical protein
MSCGVNGNTFQLRTDLGTRIKKAQGFKIVTTNHWINFSLKLNMLKCTR